MTPENFVYWLQGLLELTPDLKTLDEKQVELVRAHLGYVFEHMQPTLTLGPAPTMPAGTPIDLPKVVDDYFRRRNPWVDYTDPRWPTTDQTRVIC